MTDWVTITDETLFARLVLSAPDPVVVAFEAAHCDPCRDQRLLISLAWAHLGWSVATVRVDAGQLPALIDRYRIVGYPTLAVFAKGLLIERYPGRRHPRAFTERLYTLLNPTLEGSAHDPYRRRAS